MLKQVDLTLNWKDVIISSKVYWLVVTVWNPSKSPWIMKQSTEYATACVLTLNLIIYVCTKYMTWLPDSRSMNEYRQVWLVNLWCIRLSVMIKSHSCIPVFVYLLCWKYYNFSWADLSTWMIKNIHNIIISDFELFMAISDIVYFEKQVHFYFIIALPHK